MHSETCYCAEGNRTWGSGCAGRNQRTKHRSKRLMLSPPQTFGSTGGKVALCEHPCKHPPPIRPHHYQSARHWVGRSSLFFFGCRFSADGDVRAFDDVTPSGGTGLGQTVEPVAAGATTPKAGRHRPRSRNGLLPMPPTAGGSLQSARCPQKQSTRRWAGWCRSGQWSRASPGPRSNGGCRLVQIQR